MDENHKEFSRESFIVTTDKSRFDIHAMHAFLTCSSWAPGIDLETVRLSVKNSLCFGLFDEKRQIGFARLVTDYATFGYLCDVYVLEEYQGLGLAKWLVECSQAHPVTTSLRRIMLVTDTAAFLYKKTGFQAINRHDFVWQINRPDIYLKKCI
ncbi:GNAT family N-acetyltransferase [Yersinia sp. 2466 StPb PI]|uniref:GNAT family N-acetyltransferase n=1 Tax=Yersinia sp. 2466 StPb PI TaxID=3061648 RepID=UPI00355C74B3